MSNRTNSKTFLSCLGLSLNEEIFSVNTFALLIFATDPCIQNIHENFGGAHKSDCLDYNFSDLLLYSFINLQIFVKCFTSYVFLACHMIAIYPIICENGKDFLIPTILAYSILGTLFNAFDFILGFWFCSSHGCGILIFLVFEFTIILKILVSIYVVSLYKEFYGNISYTLSIKSAKR